MNKREDPIFVGGLFALLAAVFFGVTTPLVKALGVGVGAFWTAGLLYAGSALVSFVARSRNEAPIERKHYRRLFAIALLGAVLAPVCLAWGLQRSSATSASLLLNFEVVFTVALARVLFDEPIGSRVGTAVFLMMIGGAVLVLSGAHDSGNSTHGFFSWGALAVLAASLGWASDNALTRPLADLDPSRVVLYKSALGAALSLGAAFFTRETMPRAMIAVALVACGAIGYGASLRLYLLAQRRIGAGRTASIFAVGPFVGALAAWTMGDVGSRYTWLAGALFATAIYLHLTERHRHAHAHEAMIHEHAHRHDDQHHDHAHADMPAGEHTHVHQHEPREHSHRHAPDLHHRHRH